MDLIELSPEQQEKIRRDVVEQLSNAEMVEYQRTTIQQWVDQCRAAGYVVTITQVPQQPLAMGNHKDVVSVRPARK